MYISNSINRVSPTFLRSDLTQFSQKRETFHDVFQRTLNNKSNSRPPKTELMGILVPYAGNDWRRKFKLETDSKDHPLIMNAALTEIAKKIEWEEVTVKGIFDPDENSFEVERINLAKSSEPYRLSTGPADLYFELDEYRRTITRQGKLDLAPEFLAS
ncbi:MAG TPA: hypothetical protein VM432_11785 [Bdellovibrionales bacterium]|jgi:hypothetical protein|nr:hypothetical protein [Bdellovibrionales bacterium]